MKLETQEEEASELAKAERAILAFNLVQGLVSRDIHYVGLASRLFPRTRQENELDNIHSQLLEEEKQL